MTLWTGEGQCLDRQTRPNVPSLVDGVSVLDIDGIGEWLVDALSRYAGNPVEAIIPVAHGAGVVALGENGPLFPPLDYEQQIPSDVATRYRASRDLFAVTGSPALPAGLNMGSQLFWLQQRCPDEMAQATLVPWAQYWAWFLSGVARSEITSLGCHSDLWAPEKNSFSPLATRMGWDKSFAPLAAASDAIGTLRPELATRTSLPEGAKVLAGIHDSNAALLAARGFPQIADNEATILSTGTWFIAMRLAAEPVCLSDLDADRDCLVNIDAYGRLTPSARFMGGREIESVIEIDTRRVDIKPDQPALLEAVHHLVANGVMLLPTLAPANGPFPNHEARWIGRPDDWYARRAAMCLYAALVTEVILGLVGSQKQLLVEGRFAEAEVFVRALATLRPDLEVYTANAHNDVSYGALRLVKPELQPDGELIRVEPLAADLKAYRTTWHAALEERS